MKRVITSTTSFWSTSVKTDEQIKYEIRRSMSAGTTFEDIDDYLCELEDLGIINRSKYHELCTWATTVI